MADNPDDKQSDKLSPAQFQAVVDWLKAKIPEGHICPECKTPGANIGNEVIAALPFTSGSLSLSGQVFPVVPVTCLNCGLTRYFNAVVMGISKVPSSEAPTKEKGGENGEQK